SGAANGYDGLNQLVAFSRGALNATKDTIANAPHSQSWGLDAMGNWSSVTTTDQGVPSTQSRTHNAQNEIATVNNVAVTAYDNNGNLIKDENRQQYKYDAWNRLVQVLDPNGNLLVSYGYDALGRRLTEAVAGGVTRELYYSAAWQVLEERVPSGQAGTAPNVWSPGYVDALVLRDRDTTGSGQLGERLYVQQDANWNVTAVANPAGQVLERDVEDPYGKVTVLDPTNWQGPGARTHRTSP